MVCIEPESDTDDIFKPSEPIPEPEVRPLFNLFFLVVAFLLSSSLTSLFFHLSLLRPLQPEPVYEEPELTPQNSVINDIFHHSKQRIMEALEGVQGQVDALEVMKEVWQKAISGSTSNELDSGMIM